MFIVEDKLPKVIIKALDGEMKNWESGFRGSTFLSFFFLDLDIWGICFSTYETITGGYKSILLILNGFNFNL